MKGYPDESINVKKRPLSNARTIIIIKGKHKQDPKPDAEPPGKQSRDIHPEKESA